MGLLLAADVRVEDVCNAGEGNGMFHDLPAGDFGARTFGFLFAYYNGHAQVSFDWHWG